MAKIDKSKYTKEEFKKIKEQRRLAKQSKQQQITFINSASCT